jgi:GTP cyclohydrolase I
MERGKYPTPLEFEKEMNLIWDNCMTYNAVSSHLHYEHACVSFRGVRRTGQSTLRSPSA